ncbi:alpha-N-arabinofuranosidase [Amphibacillus marinus]|uniref:Alpha-N-arabinofuranosidase n=1 Tax=Amphibacillus marinus TaxID=872970 RepID=A0A1H8N930_9BACI|nr:glycoside hydrolase family 43 protein [Amphibacillus marinus]SEO26077.1 alpha-N-arabinofuranosidase [Amphibacillus marinus]
MSTQSAMNHYLNPVIKGFYPDPSVCKVGDDFFLVCSSFQYFPGVPIFHSQDLVNWTQIGHCITRESQIDLNKIESSGGIFAPTIRYNDGKFYMVTTNATTQQNFYLWTDDIYGDWSEPIIVDQGGIDPDLFFENGQSFFISNGQDDHGVGGVVQCEINITNGQKLSESKIIWQGTGGRYLEAPHLYKINDWYYLMAAEGGTEYGHMVTYARSQSPHGPFESYALNPVLTNRNLGGYEVQGVGHGDLIEDNNGNWWMLHLGFRQIHRWFTYHHLGREVFLTPVTFDQDGWFTAGHNGTTLASFETNRIPQDVKQTEKKIFTFENTAWAIDWCYLRHPDLENYYLEADQLHLNGSNVTLDHAESPTFIALRQKDFAMETSFDLKLKSGSAGITLYMDENHHYDLYLQKNGEHLEGKLKLNIGDIKSVVNTINLSQTDQARLMIKSDSINYSFFIETGAGQIELGQAQTKYLSSEVAGGFTGVLIGLYAVGSDHSVDQKYAAEFTNFTCAYH